MESEQGEWHGGEGSGREGVGEVGIRCGGLAGRCYANVPLKAWGDTRGGGDNMGQYSLQLSA